MGALVTIDSDLIEQAISARKRLLIWYDPGLRLIEPHAFGIGSDRQYLLRAFQVEGASKSDEHHDWKLFRVDRMQELTLQHHDEFDGPRPGYKRGDRAMKTRIIIEL